MGLRFTKVRGLQKNSNNSTIIFACHNLKKKPLWNWKNNKNTNSISSKFNKIIKKVVNNLDLSIRKVIIFFRHTTLSTV